MAIWVRKKEDSNRIESSRKVEVLERFDVFVEVQYGDNLYVDLSMRSMRSEIKNLFL